MANIGNLAVKLTADIKKFTAGMKTAATAAKTFAQKAASSMRSAASSIKTFVTNAASSLTAFASKWIKRAILALGALAVAAVKMAADAEESENLVRESFEGMTDAVIKWSERLQKELGLDAVQLRKQAGFFNLLTMSMGLTAQQAFDVSTNLTELAADMASFRNQSFEQMFEAMRSGMVGMSRPLQNLGINVKENAVEQLLLEMGINRTSQSLTEQQKIMARYITILKATKKDSGDLAHTYNSFTNVVRVLWSNLKILSREMGGPMKDAVTGLAIRMRDWLINNREDIVAWWTVAMEKFGDFVAFFQNSTWRDGISRGLELLVAVFNTFADTVFIIFRELFTRIGDNVGVWLQQSLAIAIERARLIAAEMRKIPLSQQIGEAFSGDDEARRFFAKRTADTEIDRMIKEGFFEKLYPAVKRNTTAMEDFKESVRLLGEEFANTAKEGANMGKSEEELAASAEAGNKAMQKIRMDRKAKTDQEIKNMDEQLRASLAADQELIDSAKNAADTIAEYWSNTAETIKQVMYTARMSVKDGFADMLTGMLTEFDNFEDHLRNFFIGITQAIARMQAEILAAKIMGSTESGGFGVGNWVNAGLNALAGGGGGGQAVQAKARGGLIKPVYAANGFAPRGTDTVPVMATPGEGMLSKDLTAALREQLAVPGGVGGKSMTINVSAIDAQGTAQFLEKNKRQIAGFYGQTYRSNNPNTRRIR